MLDTKQSLTVIFSDISTPLSPPVISFQSGTELSVFITTFYWHRQSQLFQSTNSIHSSSSYFFFLKLQVVAGFLVPTPLKCITLRFQLPHLFFNTLSPLFILYFPKYPLSLPLYLITTFMYLIVNTIYIITEFPLFRGENDKGILFALENYRLFITIHLW